MTITPEIPVTLSPYWLRLYGKWIHLEGIAPEVEVTSQRAFSELITVDGYRHVQRAPRGPRQWSLNYEYATASAVAALESAAYDVVLGDTDAPSGRTLLLDTNAARANMVPPEVPTQQRISTGRPAIKAGGVWQPSYSSVADKISIVYVPVRAGVTYSMAVWTTATSTVAQWYKAGDFGPVNFLGTGGTNDNPSMIFQTVTPATDGEVRILMSPPADITKSVAGLMFYEGDCPPTHYRRGQRTPCQVSVQDPTLTTNVIWPGQGCDPCALPREQAAFVVQEVGTLPVTPLEA